MQFEAFAKPDDPPGSGIVFTVTDIADGKAVLMEIIRGPASGCVSTAGFSTCAPRRRRKWSTGMCMARTAIITDGS